ncbi:MAG: GAF domain-containing protein [Myxococcales bacterium]|nr:GAF domain-containing protein [Myxococcales bacterium]
MPEPAAILVCEHFFGEAQAIVREKKLGQVDLVPLPCADAEARSATLHALSGRRIDVLAGCRPIPSGPWPPACRFHLTQSCFDLVLDGRLIEQHVRAGAHLVTPGWLAGWQRHVQRWGFDREGARECFREFAKKLLLLDTGVDPRSAERLSELSEFLALPSEVQQIGLELLELRLRAVLLQRQLDSSMERTTAAVAGDFRKVAEYAISLDLVSRLARPMVEKEAVEAVFEAFSMLFGPGKLAWLAVVDGAPGRMIARPDEGADAHALISNLGGPDSSTASALIDGGFALRVEHAGETLGIFEVSRLAVPERVHDYLNLALTLSGVCGLAISNARGMERRERDNHFKRFLGEAQAELGASLSMETVLRRAAELFVRRMADACALDVIAEGSAPRHVVQSLGVGPLWALPARPDDATHPVGEAILTGRAVLVRELAGWEPSKKALLGDGRFASLIILPLEVGGRRFGALSLAVAGRRYDARDLAEAEELAQRSAPAIENARLYEQAARAVQERNDFLSAVSHDLKNPLTAIRLWADRVSRRAAKSGSSDAERLTGDSDLVGRQVTRMSRMVDELLDFARLQVGRPLDLLRSRTDLVALVRQVARDQQNLTSRHRIVLEEKAPALVGEWDPARLERALINLVSNAVKYSPEGGQISIALWREESGESGCARVEISDQGLGIAEEDLPHLFEPFRRGKNAKGISGSGIGLASARHVLSEHRGRLELSSGEGRGTTVSVTLPLSSGPLPSGEREG